MAKWEWKWEVPSENSAGVFYKVTRGIEAGQEIYGCTCRDWTLRRSKYEIERGEPYNCKHILQVLNDMHGNGVPYTASSASSKPSVAKSKKKKASTFEDRLARI